MSILTLSEAKDHLRVTNTSEDTKIQAYIDAAEEHIEKYLNNDNFPEEPSIKQAARILIKDMYEQTMDSYAAAERLLHPHRVGLGI